jgi:hypothetical protein
LSFFDNLEKLETQSTQDDEQHGHSKKDNPEKQETQGTQDKEQHGTQKRTIQKN